MQTDGRVIFFTRLLVVSLAGLVAAAAAAAVKARRRRRGKYSKMLMKNLMPVLHRTESGRAGNLEKFSHYVARQMGFEDPSECPQLCKLAYDYLKKSKGYDELIFEYLAKETDADSLYVKLIGEFETCILTYFAFHWTQASHMITQVLSVESEKKTKLKDLVMAATRKQRFEKVSKDLKVTRVFSTLVEEMKAIGRNGEGNCTDVMMPVAHSQRSPVLLLIGGGMGAGKSTVLKDILNEPFWAEAAANAVVVEADAFKETDVIYRALSSRGHHNDMLPTADLVHQSSADAASSLLVTALNEGRDVIMDGTLSWEPYVQQTIAMARNIHKCRYRMGVGYKVEDDGTITESYWEPIPGSREQDEEEQITPRKPYRIELVGVVCDAYLAVVRGIRRAIMVKRAVGVKSQLKSHKRFAIAFPKYCELVDNARLYCTNAVGRPPTMIAWKNGESKLLVEPNEIKCLKEVSEIETDAESVYQLHRDPTVISQLESVWNDIVLSPSRPTIQRELRLGIRRIEKITLIQNDKRIEINK